VTSRNWRSCGVGVGLGMILSALLGLGSWDYARGGVTALGILASLAALGWLHAHLRWEA
jgi:hypothetical protein